jgi:hypothetical protein
VLNVNTPSIGVRIPEPLRHQAEAFGRERRWSLSEVTRVALERLVDYDPDNEAQHEGQSA